MAIGYGVPMPKPARGYDRAARLRSRASQAQRFRDAVWLRAGGVCERCGRVVTRTLDVLRVDAGHVAHNRGRRVAPEDRYNPDAATLQCSRCHLASHSMRFA